MRDVELEKRIQADLDAGHNVWVVGDVHGFFQSMTALCSQLNLREGDWVVFLGDLIDRGPNGFGVVHHVMHHPQCASVRGNHEDMMVRQFTMDKLRTPDLDMMLWMRNGGNTTVASYMDASRDSTGAVDEEGLEHLAREHTDWMARLPTHLVLNRWRLVHAGYSPDAPLDGQRDEDLLWIRGAFHHAVAPVDPLRTVVFGHTPTAGLPGHTVEDWGEVWRSDVLLEDGRSAAVGLDTCLYHGPNDLRKLTAMNLQTGEVVQQHRIEG